MPGKFSEIQQVLFDCCGFELNVGIIILKAFFSKNYSLVPKSLPTYFQNFRKNALKDKICLNSLFGL